MWIWWILMSLIVGSCILAFVLGYKLSEYNNKMDKLLRNTAKRRYER